jgi:hypothetical protein
VLRNGDMVEEVKVAIARYDEWRRRSAWLSIRAGDRGVCAWQLQNVSVAGLTGLA